MLYYRPLITCVEKSFILHLANIRFGYSLRNHKVHLHTYLKNPKSLFVEKMWVSIEIFYDLTQLTCKNTEILFFNLIFQSDQRSKDVYYSNFQKKCINTIITQVKSIKGTRGSKFMDSMICLLKEGLLLTAV